MDPTPDAYADLITRYAQRYGRPTWHIVYQADVRCRLEHMERLRRRGASESQDAASAGGAHAFRDQRPWEWVWAQAVLDAAFWRQELEEPCLLVLTRTASLGAMVDGDAAVAGSLPPPPAQPRERTQREHTERRVRGGSARAAKVHKVSGDVYEANRNGTTFCPEFLAGGCTDKIGRCPKDPSLAHQCNKCLGHHRPSTCDRRPSATKGKGKGKSKHSKN